MKLPSSYYNLVSYIGVSIAGLSLSVIIFMMILTTRMQETNPYIGIILFLLLPALLVLGLILIPLGMWLKARKVKRDHGSLTDSRFILNLNDRRHRNAALVFIFGTMVFLFFTGIGSYELYHYSESVEFCGQVCHQAMSPEYTAYQKSPHAKVMCAQCHIGSGAKWFVKAKISGLYQVYAVLANKVPHPIETPIANLRPARETCEKCHWPQKFYSNSLRDLKFYLSDEENTPWEIQLRMKIGADHSSQGYTEGIHWHINPDVQIDYIASDKKREVIPWVRYINKATGDTTIFEDNSDPLDENAKDTLSMREMDCMDCHNRPAHKYLTPSTFVNNAMAGGEVSPELPGIKALAMEIFAEQYSNTDTAMKVIENKVWNYYMENYPELIAQKESVVKQAIAGLQKGYKQNMFPEMKADWNAYPDHIGHMEFNGCFRCHNDQHQSTSGKVISRDCNLCHSIMQQGNQDSVQYAKFNENLEFRHPVDIDQAWKESSCSDCHREMY